ncbi:hypothetical protein EVAR_75388_1 [Eumeta japonica]|uniref:Uncharacterized protein n=1 Tax=Eumeta variegata TaxID=151549 RepID=A0A4C1TJX8_EUMVA|nr:hypothetical protein EVAR_75388_1 [Eumeta japonica]
MHHARCGRVTLHRRPSNGERVEIQRRHALPLLHYLFYEDVGDLAHSSKYSKASASAKGGTVQKPWRIDHKGGRVRRAYKRPPTGGRR